MPSAQNVMLAVHCKRTEQLDIKSPILLYVRNTYGDGDASEAADDLEAVQALRNELVTAQGGATGVSRETLIKYYKSLANVETRFPISNERGHVHLAFPWADAFRPTKKASQANVHFEKAAVLFNLAAVLSQQALQVERGTADGLTQACKLFQESAGVFAHLREAEANKVDAPRPVDLSPECCSMMEKLMLAQAQECVYHKAVVDKKSPGVVARLAKQAANMYAEVTAMFNGQTLVTHFEKSWVSHTQMKASLMEVLALVESAKQLNADTKIAKEIATLSECFTRLQATKKLAAAVSQEMADSLRSLDENVAMALTKAQKDNNAIYLEKVPPFSDLPAIQGALLVKPAPPANLDASTENLFTSLVPDSCAKALSKYTDMVDSAVRGALDRLAGATDAARITLRQAELPELLEALEGSSAAALPDALARELADVAAMGGTAHLRGILAEIGELRRTVEADIAACTKSLDEEAAADSAARAEFGDRWTVPQSATLSRALYDKIASYRTTMAQAGDSDGKVIARLNDSEPAFAGLTPEAVAAQMPRLQAPLMPLGEDPGTVLERLRRGMDALNALSTERAGIEEALKEMKTKDNILPKLMASPSSAYDGLFEKEIAKYAQLQADAAASAQRNDGALAAVARDAQAFRTVFEVGAWRAACESAAAAARGPLRSYREVLDHLSEGLRFYMSLQEAVRAHQQQCADFAFTRGLQRDELRQELSRRAREERDAIAAKAVQQGMAYLSVAPPPQPQHQPSYPPPVPGPGGYSPYHPPPPQPGAAAPPPPPHHAPQQPAYHAGPPPPPAPVSYGVPQPYHGAYAAAPPPPQQHHQQHPQYGAPPPAGYPGGPPAAPSPYGYHQAPLPPAPQQQQPPYGYGHLQQPPPPQQQQQQPYAYPGQQQPPYPPYPGGQH